MTFFTGASRVRRFEMKSQREAKGMRRYQRKGRVNEVLADEE